ncbi:tRNA pseudouridine55 synthase [Rhizomicrobium palustre]|uniref:tRNA pseudouridine synthase B n=1 Tax=Rhizomicrobium palustre TaxID=189966 RepID=A0A846MZ72_9PROT|nr:tRNA pseudouridine(55) synthase TruB [Rhizomicrobium palustre]NIK88250.1 tRNA pseudouridine55 synthase [Rhizomicrobium palustre]
MGRRKKGNPVHGWVIVDKPLGVTSTQAVSIVRRIFDAQKAGHAGTLDPMATGVLAVALGEATKTVPYAMDSAKTYQFTATWGESRDSDDTEGAVTGTSDKRPTREEIEALLPRFTGPISQIPPSYSAIKVDGERAYDIARDGEEVHLDARTVFVSSVRIVDMPDPNQTLFEMHCGKGTYVRAWARDMGQALGCLGHVSALRRTQVGSFRVEDATPLETLKGFMHSPAAFEHLRPLSTALDGIPALAITGQDVTRLRSGNPILIRPNMFARITESHSGDDVQGLTVYCATGEGEPVALTEFAAGELRPFRVFNFG